MKTFILVLALLTVAYAAPESKSPYEVESNDNNSGKGSEHNGGENFFHKAKEFVETKGPGIAEDLGNKFNSFKHYLGEKFSEREDHHNGSDHGEHHHDGSHHGEHSHGEHDATTESSTPSHTSTLSSHSDHSANLEEKYPIEH